MAVDELALHNFLGHTGHRGGGVFEQPLLLVRRHQAEQIPRLRVIVIAIAMTIAVGIAGDLERRFGETRVLRRSAETVRLE